MQQNQKPSKQAALEQLEYTLNLNGVKLNWGREIRLNHIDFLEPVNYLSENRSYSFAAIHSGGYRHEDKNARDD